MRDELPETFDPKKRAAEKQASRDADARALASEEKTREQLWRKNDMFAGVVSVTPGKPKRAY